MTSPETRHLFDLASRANGPKYWRSGTTQVRADRAGKILRRADSRDRAPGGNDWIAIRDDGATRLDARAVLETDDGALIALAWTGIRHGSAEVMQQIAAGEDVDPATYYFRSVFSFDSVDERYDWLNRIVAPATGKRSSDGVEYSVYELL